MLWRQLLLLPWDGMLMATHEEMRDYRTFDMTGVGGGLGVSFALRLVGLDRREMALREALAEPLPYRRPDPMDEELGDTEPYLLLLGGISLALAVPLEGRR